jgi:hypothetical protein
MAESLLAAVRRRAGYACEYCRLPEGADPVPFEVEHVVAKQHGGPTVLSNLAYACLHCNRHKGPNLAGLDKSVNPPKLVPLFNPPRHKWSRHFRWEGPYVVARTAVGRVTVEVLAMNDPLWVALREELAAEGRFPPRTGES